MAIWHADNFSMYGTDINLMLNGIYAQLYIGSGGPYFFLSTDPDGVSSGHVGTCTTNPGNTGGFRVVHPGGNQTTMGVCTRVWMSSLPDNDDYDYKPIQIRNSATTVILWVGISSTGRLRIQSSAGTVATTTVPAITANGWYHLELLADQTEVELRVEGVTVLGPIAHSMVSPEYAQAGAIAENGSVNQSSRRMYVKDLVCYDGTGSYNTDFIGSVLVTNLLTASDVSLNWTPSTGSTGYNILDNIPPVDSQYIFAEDDPLPSPYVATLTDLPDEVTSVKAIVTYVRAAKSDGGDGSLQVGLISDPDGTPATVLGTDRPITTAQTYWRDVFEEDPATNAPWIPAAVNEAQLQIDRTT